MEPFYAPISALQHLLVCDRQAALIHVEGIWLEDRATASGRALHETVDLPGSQHRRGVRVLHAVPLVSEKLRLSGRADAVEIHGSSPPRYLPVEYKRGRGRFIGADTIQVAAQALCLEEMHGTKVPEAALFYAASRKRVPVAIDENLRRQVLECVKLLHVLLESKITPPARPRPLCQACSLRPVCLPELTTVEPAAGRYLAALLRGELP